MDNTQRFTTKAGVYAAHRWDYAPQAIETLITMTGIDAHTAVADIGAGTGMVTRHFVERGIRTYAVEPNAAMRRFAEATLGHFPGFTRIAAVSDATGLPTASVDLITVGRALHWLPVESTQREFQRILKPGGWLATMGVSCTDKALTEACEALRSAENGWELTASKASRPAVALAEYTGANPLHEIHVPAAVTETWPQFLGRMLSFSSAPDPDSELYARNVEAAAVVFNQFAVAALLTITVSTDITYGQLADEEYP
jgi:SAM-dependent methyltransferase